MNFYKYAERFVYHKLGRVGLQKKSITTKKFQIDYWDTETKKPCIFLLNGFGANSEFQWFRQVAVLEEYYRIVLVNLLYFGDSKPILETAYKIKNQIDFIESLRVHLKTERVSIAAISYGGLVALEYVNTFPDKLEKLILIDPANKYLTLEHLQKVCNKYKVDTIENFFAPPDYRKLKIQFQAAYFKPPKIPNIILKSIHKNMCAPYRRHWIGLIQELRVSTYALSNKEYQINKPIIIF